MPNPQSEAEPSSQGIQALHESVRSPIPLMSLEIIGAWIPERAVVFEDVVSRRENRRNGAIKRVDWVQM